ncbi:MAG TPA: nuclear transport factor 2 family protein [Anaeromyxobacteraceae bacterium]|nr:nuclear transport factor 2 family protein [Anaeromyxobacteraceae bacterium]
MPPSASSSLPRRSGRLGAPILFPAALALLAAAAAWAFRDRLQSLGSGMSLESPDTQIRRALAAQTRARLDDVYGFRAGGTAELMPVRFRDVAVAVEGEQATVVAMLDAEGRVTWRDRAADLSYLGRERFHMRPCRIALWCGDGEQFQHLRQVLLVLFRRLDAFEARDAAAYAGLVADGYRDRGLGREALLGRVAADFQAGPRAAIRVLAWQIRVERDRAEVGEDYQIEVAGRAPERLRARLLLAREGERWVFAGGL